jgi:hypothetical protein
MSVPFKFLLWMIGGCIAILLVMAYLGASLPAHAHDWYSGTKDPVSGYGCCGGSDCAIIDPRWVHAVEGGVRIVMTAEQAASINPSTTRPIDAFVPEARIQRSPDYDSHACVYQSDRGAPRYGVICFWAAGTT